MVISPSILKRVGGFLYVNGADGKIKMKNIQHIWQNICERAKIIEKYWGEGGWKSKIPQNNPILFPQKPLFPIFRAII